MKKTYSEKLRDPRWQKMRLLVMERDGFRCRQCNAKDKTLNVHHLIYEKGKEPWECGPEVLVTLCEDCHSGVEDRTNKILMAQIACRIHPLHLRMLLRLLRDAACLIPYPVERSGIIDHPVPHAQAASDIFLAARDMAVAISYIDANPLESDILHMP